MNSIALNLYTICSSTLLKVGIEKTTKTIHFNMFAAASPAELTDHSQKEGTTIAEYSFLYAPHPR